MVDLVDNSTLLRTPDQVFAYYAHHLAGRRELSVHGTPVAVHFPKDGGHLYSRDHKDGDDSSLRIVRRISGGKVEVRTLDLERAGLLDRIIPTIEGFVVSVPGTGFSGGEKKLLHGPRLASGQYLRVVLRPRGGGDWECVSAYPVSAQAYAEALRAKRAKFPP